MGQSANVPEFKWATEQTGYSALCKTLSLRDCTAGTTRGAWSPHSTGTLGPEHTGEV